jgi:hypothetical protein
MKECTLDVNLKECTCTYASCKLRGHCCACILYHRRSGEIPGCFFSTEGEALWDRSCRAFLRDRGGSQKKG